MASSKRFVAIYHAYVACRRYKRATREAQRYEQRLLDNLVDTAQAMDARSWRPHRSAYFVTLRPKAREIHAACFSDRVVHHYLVPRLEIIYERLFIHDSYSNRRGKGIHAAVERLQGFARQATRNGKRPAYYLQLDIANFFNRVDRRRLYIMIRDRLRHGMRFGELTFDDAYELLWLTGAVLADEPGRTSQYVGDPTRRDRVPPHKRLSEAPSGHGLPIGNLPSQFFANVYLNELDQFIKHSLRCRHYLRYVDDFVLLHEDPQQLAIWREQIVAFLAERLGLALRDEGRLRPIGDGIDFLGYIVRSGYRLVRRRVATHLDERLHAFEKRLFCRDRRGVGATILRVVREELQSSLTSYLGHYHHASSWRLAQRAFARHPWLTDLFQLQDDLHLQPIWQPPSVNSLRGQWRWFSRHGSNQLVLIQVGNRIELYDADAEKLHQCFGLPLQAVSRPGFKATLSLPMVRLRDLRVRLRRQRLAHRFVAEEGWLPGGMKRRVLRLFWTPHSLPLPAGGGWGEGDQKND
ncbi:RNA-directed DNA polymerase [Gammaproteobacteria bacterium]